MDIQEKDSGTDHPLKEGSKITPGEIFIPVIKEDVTVGKKVVETGKIKITKSVIEEDRKIDVSLLEEEIEIKTIAVNQYLDTMPEAVRYEGDTMIIPVLKEVSVVRILLEKEIHITRKQHRKQETHHVTLRSEEVNMEKDADNKKQPSPGS